MSSDMFFDENDHWNSSGGIFDMVLEEIAATVSSTTVAELLLCVVENHIGMVGLDQLSASDQVEFLHAITGGLRDKIMAQIPADNPIRHLTTARLDNLVEMAKRQLRLREQ